MWEAKLVGQAGNAVAYSKELKNIAKSHRLSFLRPREVAELPLSQFAERLSAVEDLVKPGECVSVPTVEALLGPTNERALKVSGAYSLYLEECDVKQKAKSIEQRKKWRRNMDRTVRLLIDAVGDIPFLEMERVHVRQFRDALKSEIDHGAMQGRTANKYISAISKMYKIVSEKTGAGSPNPFEKQRFEVGRARKRPAFTTQWIQEKLLAPEALSGLDDDARDVFLLMVNTGARPSEILSSRACCV